MRRSQRKDATDFIESHRSEPSSEVYGIADLAQEFGITTRAIRFYETKGLLHPRRVNGARVYSRRDRARLVLILRAKSIGSSLDDIREFLDLYGKSGEGRARQLAYVIDKTDAAIAELREKRRRIDQTLNELEHINRTCRERRDGRRT